MKVKEKKFLMGLLGIALVISLALTGCPVEPEGGPPTPKEKGPDDLPALPAGSTGIGTEADADTLLAALKESGLGETVQDTVGDILNANATKPDNSGNYSYEFKDKAKDKVKVSAKASQTTSGELASLLSGGGDNIEDPSQLFPLLKKGAKASVSMSDETTATLIDDLTSSSGGLKLIKDSFGTTKSTGSQNAEITNVPSNLQDEAASAELKIKMSGDFSSNYSYGWTVVNGDKAAKLILNAEDKQTLNGKEFSIGEMMSGGESLIKPTVTITGSLKVYGAEDKLVKTINITTEQQLSDVLAYFGVTSAESAEPPLPPQAAIH